MRILIICTANSCRSQMAETFLKELNPDMEVYSAGTKVAQQVHPKTIEVMMEAGYNITNNVPEDVSKHINQPWDYVVTVCDDAKESCPVFQAHIGKKIHYRFIDPATELCIEEQRIMLFRQVRDELKSKMKEFYFDFIHPRMQ